jgi:hypothetical protein
MLLPSLSAAAAAAADTVADESVKAHFNLTIIIIRD